MQSLENMINFNELSTYEQFKAILIENKRANAMWSKMLKIEIKNEFRNINTQFLNTYIGDKKILLQNYDYLLEIVTEQKTPEYDYDKYISPLNKKVKICIKPEIRIINRYINLL